MSDIKNSKNIATGSIEAGGDVHIGDNVINHFKGTTEFKKLADDIQNLDEEFKKTRAKIDKYPDDDDFKQDLLRIDAQRSQKEKDLATLKQEVLKLAEEFTRIPLNTERLRLAKAHFDKGEFKEARAILDAEKMAPELDAAIQKEALGQKLQEQAKVERENLANEYLVLARLTAIDFDLPDRFEKTKAHFEQSLRAERNAENLFACARFLQEHNQYQEASRLYEELLKIYRILAEADPESYQVHVAGTLNNLGILHCVKNELAQAESEYEESLQIRRSLAAVNPQSYLPYVAGTLNNLGILHCVKNELAQAEIEYAEALQIRRSLAAVNPQSYLTDVAGTLNNLGLLHSAKNELAQAEIEYAEALQTYQSLAAENPQSYLPYVAGTLNNLANLQYAKNELAQAESEYAEALQIYRSLAEVSPQSYLPNVAMTLNNLAVLHSDKNELAQAEIEYEEALKIRRSLAEVNPQSYLPDMAMTSVNMGAFYLESMPDKEKSIDYCREALWAALPFWEYLPAAQNYADTAKQVIQAWGEDFEAIIQEIRAEQQ